MAETRVEMSWLKVAELILRDSTEPLHSNEIVKRARRRKLIASEAHTPDHSLQAAIWRHRKQHGDASPFVMVGEGRRFRKYWLRSKQEASGVSGETVNRSADDRTRLLDGGDERGKVSRRR